MKKKLISCIFAFVTFLTFVACEEANTDSYPPIWYGFRLEPYPPVAGDSLTVTAVQAKKGSLIHATTYKWTLTYNLDKDGINEDTVITVLQNTNYDGISNADPTCRFHVPVNASGRAALSFEAKYSFSGNGYMGTFGNNYERPEGIRGNITSYSGILDGGAKGSFSFNIMQK